MIKHIILWKIKDEYDTDKKRAVSLGIKNGLEGLYGKIEGLVEIKVNINPEGTSTCDVMLDSTFESMDAYLSYKKSPAHLAVADTAVRPNVSQRLCFDYEI